MVGGSIFLYKMDEFEDEIIEWNRQFFEAKGSAEFLRS